MARELAEEKNISQCRTDSVLSNISNSRCQLLVCGPTGSGKSSLIKSVLGLTEAIDKPFTPNHDYKLKLFLPEPGCSFPIAIWDSRGLELGTEGYFNEMKEGIILRQNANNIDNRIHCAWFVIATKEKWDIGYSEFIHFLRENSIPTVIVVNKSDNASKRHLSQEKIAFIAALNAYDGINFEDDNNLTICFAAAAPEKVTKCPQCDDDKVFWSTETRAWMCANERCKKTGLIGDDDMITPLTDELTAHTLKVLPECAKEIFLITCAQTQNHQRNMAIGCIVTACGSAVTVSVIPGGRVFGLTAIQTAMIAAICAIYRVSKRPIIKRVLPAFALSGVGKFAAGYLKTIPVLGTAITAVDCGVSFTCTLLMGICVTAFLQSFSSTVDEIDEEKLDQFIEHFQNSNSTMNYTDILSNSCKIGIRGVIETMLKESQSFE